MESENPIQGDVRININKFFVGWVSETAKIQADLELIIRNQARIISKLEGINEGELLSKMYKQSDDYVINTAAEIWNAFKDTSK